MARLAASRKGYSAVASRLSPDRFLTNFMIPVVSSHFEFVVTHDDGVKSRVSEEHQSGTCFFFCTRQTGGTAVRCSQCSWTLFSCVFVLMEAANWSSLTDSAAAGQ